MIIGHSLILLEVKAVEFYCALDLARLLVSADAILDLVAYVFELD